VRSFLVVALLSAVFSYSYLSRDVGPTWSGGWELPIAIGEPHESLNENEPDRESDSSLSEEGLDVDLTEEGAERAPVICWDRGRNIIHPLLALRVFLRG
jgi:hypothetical protein